MFIEGSHGWNPFVIRNIACVCVGWMRLQHVCVYLGMLAGVCVFMHVSLHSCQCSRTSLWQWKTLLDCKRSFLLAKHSRRHDGSGWHVTNNCCCPLWKKKKTTKQVLTTDRGGVTTPGPNFNGARKVFLNEDISLWIWLEAKRTLDGLQRQGG